MSGAGIAKGRAGAKGVERRNPMAKKLSACERAARRIEVEYNVCKGCAKSNSDYVWSREYLAMATAYKNAIRIIREEGEA